MRPEIKINLIREVKKSRNDLQF